VSKARAADGASFFDESRRRALGSKRLRHPALRLFRRTVWRRLPRPFRRFMLEIVFRPNRAPVAIGAPAREPLCVVGLLSTPTGIGEGGRLCGRALASLGYDVRSVDASELLEGMETMPTDARLLERGPGTVILHFNPDHLPPTLALMGRRRLMGKRIIGYWAWELPRIPDAWMESLGQVDEVWTPSLFVAEAVRPFTSRPVRVVPHPVALERPGRPRRARFGMEGRFCVLAMFSFASSFQRKNPLGAVHAFRRAFGDSADHLLILKVSDALEAPAELAELLAAIDGAPNIRIEERRLSDQERLDLIASADLLLSLHRSEGFGLVMAEAMLAGTLVVATAWSGNMDYMDESSALLVPARMVEASDSRGVYSYGECWAEPDLDVAAAHLEAAARDPAAFESIRQAARRMAAERLGVAAYRRILAEALGPIAARRRGAPSRRGQVAARAGLGTA
jgi:glycosyltransferase involved in cell wall biosynthesis